MKSHFGKVVQNFELKSIGGAHKDHQLTPLHVTTRTSGRFFFNLQLCVSFIRIGVI